MSASGGLHEFADSQFGHCFSWGEDRESAREYASAFSNTCTYIPFLVAVFKVNLNLGCLIVLVHLFQTCCIIQNLSYPIFGSFVATDIVFEKSIGQLWCWRPVVALARTVSQVTGYICQVKKFIEILK